MATHSPLPWRVVAPNIPRVVAPNIPPDSDGVAAGIESADGWTIADTYADVAALTHEIGQANAAYIVRVCNLFPELIAALAALARRCEREMVDPIGVGEIQHAKAVLAKAEAC